MSRLWLLMLAIVVVIFIGVVWAAGAGREGFITVDPDTVEAQRQQLQLEGERRYNDFARVQSPNTPIDPSSVIAALQTGVAVPTSKTASLLSIIGSSLGFGAADDGTGKVGSGVEQTGMVAQKIAFCESLGTDCTALQDPRAAECGICLYGGTDSAGNAHKGGLFISSDDQLRNGFGQQKPTIGTCPASNFVTDPTTWCPIRSNELKCEIASVLTNSDECGMCFGGASAGKNGLVYMGPKGRTFDAQLNISHPGFHTDNNGISFSVARLDGTVIASLPASTSGVALDPKSVTLPGIKEGDQFVITIRGPPVVWAGYLTTLNGGTRYVSLDIGIQSLSPAGAFEVAGDAYSSMVTNVMNGLGNWSAYQSALPRTVMWYQRQSNAVPSSVIRATYGSPANTVDATPQIAVVAGTGTGAIVSQGVNYMNIGLSADPDSTVQKNLFMTQDNGNTLVYHDNTQVDPSKFQNTITLYFMVPATLADPTGPTDMADCPTGPIITTTAGLGLFGAHSCYKPDGSANLTTGCLTELFQGAGGQTSGLLNPASTTASLLAAVATANSVTDPSTVTIDMITNYLGLQNDIVTYQADQFGNPVSFAVFQAAAQNLLGRTPGNPCDTPAANTGPHSAECLDYLWRTSGNVGAEPKLPNGDPTQLPYQYCTAAGQSAPLQANGAPNPANVAAANQQGGMSNVRSYFNSLYQRATGAIAGTPDDQNTAMLQCMGTNFQAPPPKPFDQCAPEVFQVVPNAGYSVTQGSAAAICSFLGATVATTAQVQEAYGFGGEWCSAGWVSDDTQNAYYPMQSLKPGCGNGAGVQQYNANWLPNQTAGTGSGNGNGNPATALAGVNCYGVKPPQGTVDIQRFNEGTNTWNAPLIPKVGMTVSLTPINDTTQVARHSNFALITGTPGDSLIALDGTFSIVAANNGIGGYISFESVNFPGYFLRHSNFMVYLQQGIAGDTVFPNDTSFAVVAPVATGGIGRGFSIQASNFPDHYMTFNGAGFQISMATSLVAAAVWQLEPALNGAKNLSS
jgi:hypothetical protein